MKNNGFTLIEMLIVVAIIGIISAIAIPNYSSYVVRGKRTECRSAILQVMQQQERFFTQQNTYLAYTSGAANVPMKQFSGESAASSACTIKAEACAAVTIAACALVTGTPVKADPEVANITMQTDGTKSCTGTDTSKCW